MKIAIFTESYPPYISGVSRSVELAKKGLEKLGHEVLVFAPDYPGSEHADKNVIRFPSLPAKYPGFRIAIPLPRLIPDQKFDIIHSNSPFGMGQLAKRLAKKLKAPYVYSFHTLFTDYLHYLPLPKAWGKILLLSYMKSFCRTCGKIIAPNFTTLEYIKGMGIAGDFATIPSGVDMDFVAKASGEGLRNKLGVSENSKILLYVGRLSKEKNLPFLFAAFAKIIKECPSACFVLAASGPEEQDLKRLARESGVAEKVVFAGQIKYPQVLDYYKVADVFVFASKTETQGLVIAEAKACGLPVVAVNSGGIKESVVNGEDGFLVDEDHDAFCERVVLLCKNDELRSSMSKNAKHNSTNAFSVENVAKRLESVYNSLLNTADAEQRRDFRGG